MRSIKYRVITLLLCVAFCCTLWPVSAFAAIEDIESVADLLTDIILGTYETDEESNSDPTAPATDGTASNDNSDSAPDGTADSSPANGSTQENTPADSTETSAGNSDTPAMEPDSTGDSSENVPETSPEPATDTTSTDSSSTDTSTATTEPTETVPECTCGTSDGIHTENCALYTAPEAETEDSATPDCDCGVADSTSPVSNHNDSCAIKLYYNALYAENDAETLAEMWSSLPADAQTYILNDESWTDQTKRAALVALIENGTTDPEVEVKDATFDGGETLTVSDVPENIDIIADYGSDADFDNAETYISEDNPDLSVKYIFDISFTDGWQPNGTTVEVVLNNLDIDETSDIVIYHFLGNQEISADSLVETITNYTYENGTLTFETDSFSKYVIASGNTTYGASASITHLIMKANTTNVYYVLPGTTITFYSVGTTQNSNNYNITLGNKTNWNVTSNNIGLTPTKSDKITSKFTVTVPTTATANNEAFVTAESGGSAKIIVKSKQELLEMGMNGTSENTENFFFMCLANPNAGLPKEPNVNERNFFAVLSDYSKDGIRIFDSGDISGYFNIDKSFYDDFVVSVDGTCTLGMVDYTGVKIKNALKNINWDKALKFLATYAEKSPNSYGNTSKWEIPIELYADDGTRITKNNYKNYELVPYVLKMQTVSGLSWNLDCYIRAKKSVVLDYNINLDPDRYNKVPYIMPDPFTSLYDSTTKKWGTHTVDDVFEIGSSYQFEDSTGNKYKFTFLGWNTKPDGTGYMIDNNTGNDNAVIGNYKKGDNIYVAKNITLYAQWQYTGLKIEKTVDVSDNSFEPETNESFEINVSFNSNLTFTYKIYDANGPVFENGVHKSGSITKSGVISLCVGQYALFDVTGSVTVTVQEKKDQNIPDYWSLDTESYTKTTNLESSDIPTITVTNKYNKPLTADLTITKTGANTTLDPNQSFLFHVSGPNSFSMDVIIVGNGSVTIKDLPVGNYTVTEDESWSWRYTVDGENGKSVTVNPTGENSVTFNNTRDKTQWLDGNASAHNDFSKANGN